jgi:hypothetical protein
MQPHTLAEKRPDSVRSEHVPIALRSLDAQQQGSDVNENFSATALSKAQLSAEVLQPQQEYAATTTALLSSYRQSATRMEVSAPAPTPSDLTELAGMIPRAADPMSVETGGELVEAGMEELESLHLKDNAGDNHEQDAPAVCLETETWLLELTRRVHSIPREQEREMVEEQLVMEAEWRKGDKAEEQRVTSERAKVASEVEWRRSQERAEAEWRRK